MAFCVFSGLVGTSSRGSACASLMFFQVLFLLSFTTRSEKQKNLTTLIQRKKTIKKIKCPPRSNYCSRKRSKSVWPKLERLARDKQNALDGKGGLRVVRWQCMRWALPSLCSRGHERTDGLIAGGGRVGESFPPRLFIDGVLIGVGRAKLCSVYRAIVDWSPPNNKMQA